ncbi:MAG: arginase family protein [Promethearchaeota archaeon]
MTFFDVGEIIDEKTEFVLFGIPWDYLTSLDNANSSIAPAHLRKISKNLALTTELGMEIPNLNLVDVGDVSIIPMKVESNFIAIQHYIEEIYQQKRNVILVMIGGDHFCTYPVVKTIGDNFKEKEKFGVLIFDAHLDFYEEWDKSIYSHATVSHRIYDLDYVSNKNLLIVGTRDVDILELEFAKKEEIRVLPAYELSTMELSTYINNLIRFFKEHEISQLYVSIDIDVLDPSIAPGTGYAIPGGFTYRELWHILKKIAENFNVISFDLVEISPNLDLPNNMTCNVAAKTIIEFISFIKSRKAGESKKNEKK